MEMSYVISNGPSREDLFDSLRLGEKLDRDERVKFVVVSEKGKEITIPAEVLGIKIHELPESQFPDHKKQEWELQLFVLYEGPWSDFPCYRPVAFYNTQTRKGKMVLA